jgi:hypothetical protein
MTHRELVRILVIVNIFLVFIGQIMTAPPVLKVHDPTGKFDSDGNPSSGNGSGTGSDIRPGIDSTPDPGSSYPGGSDNGSNDPLDSGDPAEPPSSSTDSVETITETTSIDEAPKPSAVILPPEFTSLMEKQESIKQDASAAIEKLEAEKQAAIAEKAKLESEVQQATEELNQSQETGKSAVKKEQETRHQMEVINKTVNRLSEAITKVDKEMLPLKDEISKLESQREKLESKVTESVEKLDQATIQHHDAQITAQNTDKTQVRSQGKINSNRRRIEEIKERIVQCGQKEHVIKDAQKQELDDIAKQQLELLKSRPLTTCPDGQFKEAQETPPDSPEIPVEEPIKPPTESPSLCHTCCTCIPSTFSDVAPTA